MIDFKVNQATFGQFVSLISAEITQGREIHFAEIEQDTGKWGMAKLWRVWMESTCKYMNSAGVRMPLMVKSTGESYGSRGFTPEDCHLLFTSQWLGVDKDGMRLSWSKKGRDGMRAATKGERFHAMLRHEEWALSRGIVLMKPRDSEYWKLEQESNE